MPTNQDPDIAELCRAVKNTVQRAIHSPEMQEIGRTVRDISQEISHEVKSAVRDAAREIPKEAPRHIPPVDDPSKAKPRYQYKYEYKYDAKKKTETPYVYNTPKTAGLMKNGSMSGVRGRGIAAGVVGIVGVSFAGALCVPLAVALLSEPLNSLLLGLGAGLLVGISVFSSMIEGGFRKKGLAERFVQYRQIIGNDRICPIGLLAETLNRPIKKVRADLQWMIRKGWFTQAKLDKEQTTLILDIPTYMQYLEASKKVKAVKPAPQPEEKPAPAADKPAPSSELESTLREGQQYIQRIRAANDLIPGEDISRKIDRIEQICTKIFYHVEQHPQKLPELRRFMQYYLPTTLKLLEAYCRFEAQPTQGENIRSAKQEIEETLDTIVLAFENLLDSLFASEALDITTDISTLSAMLAQEGLTGSDFKKQTEQPE